MPSNYNYGNRFEAHFQAPSLTVRRGYIANVTCTTINWRWRQWLDNGAKVLLLLSLLLSERSLIALNYLTEKCGLRNGRLLPHLRKLHPTLGISRRSRLVAITNATIIVRCIYSGLAFLWSQTPRQ